MLNIEKNHGHWQLKGNLKILLMECRAKESSRYAINGVHIGKNVLAATDGHRLVELQFEHNIPEGNYFCTADGFLLNFTDGKFPKYRDIIPKKSQLKKIVEISSSGENAIGLIIGEICHAGCICKLSLYKKPIAILSKVIAGMCRVYVSKKEPEHRPFIIEAETSIGDLCYVQMPISDMENKVMVSAKPKPAQQ